jgi:uncharacterized protein YaeQ
MILHFDYELNHTPLHLYGESGTVTLFKTKGEGMPHIAMKLVSYLLFFHPDLQIEKTANQNWKPDLVCFDDAGNPTQWIDCGATKRHKLDRISVKNKKTYIDIIKKNVQSAENYKAFVEKTLRQPERVRYWSFDKEFLEKLCLRMKGRHKVVATITENMEHLYFEIDGELLSTRIHNV